jgi:hypothetical protein
MGRRLLTFEFSHFLSPNSIYPSALNLYQRHREYRNNGRATEMN